MIARNPPREEHDRLQELVDELARVENCVVTLAFSNVSFCGTPPRNQGQLTLDGMEMPRHTEFLGQGE